MSLSDVSSKSYTYFEVVNFFREFPKMSILPHTRVQLTSLPLKIMDNLVQSTLSKEEIISVLFRRILESIDREIDMLYAPEVTLMTPDDRNETSQTLVIETLERGIIIRVRNTLN